MLKIFFYTGFSALAFRFTIFLHARAWVCVCVRMCHSVGCTSSFAVCHFCNTHISQSSCIVAVCNVAIGAVATSVRLYTNIACHPILMQQQHISSCSQTATCLHFPLCFPFNALWLPYVLAAFTFLPYSWQLEIEIQMCKSLWIYLFFVLSKSYYSTRTLLKGVLNPEKCPQFENVCGFYLIRLITFTLCRVWI